MYGEPAYHGAYDSREADNSNGMHRSPSAGSWYQGKFGRTSMSNIDEHQPTDETHHAHSMPAPQSIQCAYQGRFGTMPQAKMMEPQHSGELERKGSAYHGKFAQ